MSVSNLGPFPLTGIGQTLTIIPAGQYSGPNQLSQVLLTNLSYYTIALTSSTDGTLLNLLPGQVSVYPAPRSGGSLTGVVIGGTGNSTSVLDAQLGLGDTTFDGSYPYTVALPAGLVSLLSAIGGGTTTVTPSAAATGLLVVSTTPIVSASLNLGATSGMVPVPVTALNSGAAGSEMEDATYYVGPLMSPGPVTITPAGSGGVVLIDEIDALWSPLGEAQSAYTVVVPNPAAGADWTYTLPAPARLTSLQAYLDTAAATRIPYLALQTSPGVYTAFIPMTNNVALAAGNPSFCMFPAAAIILGTATNATYTAPLPDLLLAAGAIIGSFTKALAISDQWNSIVLTLSPV